MSDAVWKSDNNQDNSDISDGGAVTGVGGGQTVCAGWLGPAACFITEVFVLSLGEGATGVTGFDGS